MNFFDRFLREWVKVAIVENPLAFVIFVVIPLSLFAYLWFTK